VTLAWRSGQVQWDPQLHEIRFHDVVGGELRLLQGESIVVAGVALDRGKADWLAFPPQCTDPLYLVHSVRLLQP
jgi:hypothetical protein